ncbi:MAG: DUF885 family protein, partial [Gammaproteobacteria bacterium]
MSMRHLKEALCGAALCLATGSAAADSVSDLRGLFNREWQRNLAENPITASFLGVMQFNGKWPDLSLSAITTSHQADLAAVDALRAIDRSDLPTDEQLNYDLFKQQLKNSIERYAYRDFLMPINQRNGIQTADQIAELLPFTGEQHYRDWVMRLETLGDYMEQTIALLDSGVKEGRTQARIVMQRVPKQVAAQIVDDPELSPWYAPFKKIPESLPT